MYSALMLSRDDLEHVLQAILTAQPLGSTPLKELACFQARIHQEQHLGEVITSAVEDYLLIEWLNRSITTALNQHRRHYRLPPAGRNTARPAAQRALSADFRQNSVELEAWSLLYFRYVRVDLEWSLEELTTLTNQHERTLRRRRKHGAQRLLQHMLYEEFNYRRRVSVSVFSG